MGQTLAYGISVVLTIAVIVVVFLVDEGIKKKKNKKK